MIRAGFLTGQYLISTDAYTSHLLLTLNCYRLSKMKNMATIPNKFIKSDILKTDHLKADEPTE